MITAVNTETQATPAIMPASDTNDRVFLDVATWKPLATLVDQLCEKRFTLNRLIEAIASVPGTADMEMEFFCEFAALYARRMSFPPQSMSIGVFTDVVKLSVATWKAMGGRPVWEHLRGEA